jgi:hypothetical protein
MFRKVRRGLRVARRDAHITQPSGRLKVGSRPSTFVLICGPSFDQTVPTAGTVCRLGWRAALEQLGIPYLLVSAPDVSRALPGLPNPFCWIAGSDYPHLSEAGLAALRRTRHMVWVDTWFKDEMQFRARHDLPLNTLPDEVRERVVSSEPAFVFTISPQASFEYDDLWIERGLNLVSLPLACDATRYPSEPPHVARFDGVEMAFVGGYWPYKARQFDRYLKRYEDRLTVYGWSRWPYAGFGGPSRRTKKLRSTTRRAFSDDQRTTRGVHGRRSQ